MKRVVNQTRGTIWKCVLLQIAKEHFLQYKYTENSLLYQEDNTRFSVEKKRFELYTIKNVDKTKRGESDREDDDKRLL